MKKVNHYSDQFKRRVVNEILSGTESLETVLKPLPERKGLYFGGR
jgi:transposase-like protein